MSAQKDSEDCCVEQMSDHSSANDQILMVVGQLADKASDAKLRERLKKATKGISKKDYAAKLDPVTAEIYCADENMTDLAERSVNVQANG